MTKGVDLDSLEIELIAVGDVQIKSATKLHRICPHTAEWAAEENERHPNRRHEAIVCELAGRKHPICDGHTRPGNPCYMSPRLYETVCRMHGGNGPRSREIGAQRRAAAKAAAEVQRFAAPVDIDPQQAMMETLQSKAGQVMYLRMLVNGLTEAGLKQTDKTGSFERPSVWVEMLWRAERDLADMSKMMIDVGFAERQARYVDAQALMLVSGLAWLRKELGMAEDPRWEHAERSMLLALAQGFTPDGRQNVIEGSTTDA
jgi:hypothetical protein